MMKTARSIFKAGAGRQGQRGFTLIELLTVMAILALLLTLAVPRYFNSLDKSREALLRQDLAVMRDAIDKYYADTGKYPETLDHLVEARYLRKIAPDPVTGKADSWVVVAPEDESQGGVYDVISGASGKASDGSEYKSW